MKPLTYDKLDQPSTAKYGRAKMRGEGVQNPYTWNFPNYPLYAFIFRLVDIIWKF